MFQSLLPSRLWYRSWVSGLTSSWTWVRLHHLPLPFLKHFAAPLLAPMPFAPPLIICELQLAPLSLSLCALLRFYHPLELVVRLLLAQLVEGMPPLVLGPLHEEEREGLARNEHQARRCPQHHSVRRFYRPRHLLSLLIP